MNAPAPDHGTATHDTRGPAVSGSELLLGRDHRGPVAAVRDGDHWACTDGIRRHAAAEVDGWEPLVTATQLQQAVHEARAEVSRQAHTLGEQHQRRHARDLEDQRARMLTGIEAAVRQHAAAVRLARTVRGAGRRTVRLADLLAALDMDAP